MRTKYIDEIVREVASEEGLPIKKVEAVTHSLFKSLFNIVHVDSIVLLRHIGTFKTSKSLLKKYENYKNHDRAKRFC